ncbi:MAG TPA: hypothetical protein VM120_04435 [Bryobacteraceae bacterium]|nr:hypothetical protein [Bryobacteraceae bacterium]
MRTIPLLILASLPAFGQSLVVSPTSLNYSYQIGGSQPASQNLNVSSTGFSINYNVFTSGASWLSVFPSSGSTPGTVSVSVNTTGLTAGTYNSFVSIASSSSAVTVPVALTVTAGSSSAASPSSLAFTYSLGGSLPTSQTVAITSNPTGSNFSTSAFTSSGGNWLSVLPFAGQTPSNISVSVNTAGLAVGTYNGQVNVYVANQENPITIPVTFTVTPTGTTVLTVSPTAFTFNYSIGSVLPSPQTLSISTPSASTYTISYSNPGWLTVTPLSGASPGSASIGVTPSGFAAGTYTSNLTVTTANGGSAVVPVTLTVTQPGTTTSSRFVPVVPCRVADTRASSGFGGTFGAPQLPASSTRDFNIPFSSCGIPSGVQAYSLNITVVPAGPLSFLTAYPAGQTRPNASTLNAFDGAVTSNAAIVPAGANGAISLFVTDPTDVIIDINGYFTTAAGALALYPVNPCRIADTRNPFGPFGGPQLFAGTTRDFNIPTSACGISTAAQAYSLNATVVPPGPLSFLTLFPTGQARPNVSTLNSFDGSIKANAAIVPAGSSGGVSAFVTDRTDLVLDINAYFAPSGFTGGLSFYPVTPCRVADTRDFPSASIPGGTSRDFLVQNTCGVPTNAAAYSFNVTVVPSGPLSFLTLWPAGNTRPVVSTLNSFAGKVVANAAIVPTGFNGAVSVFVTNTTHVILDINGYFAP